MSDELRPTHIVPSGATRTLCKLRTNRDVALPYVNEAFVKRNLGTSDLPLCETCLARFVLDAEGS